MIEKILENVKVILREEKKQCLAHRLDHFLRVRENAVQIAQKYECDKEMLSIAALLHDIDHPFDDKKNHAERSAKKAAKILGNLNYSKKDEVLRIIEEHSTENIIDKKSIESKILFDADKIDGLGAIGVARVFLMMGQNGKTMEESIEWYRGKIKIAINSLQTREGKEIAKQKLQFTEEFLNAMESSLNNKLKTH